MLCAAMARPRKVSKRAETSPSARLNMLSPKRQEIIRPALDRPREFVLLSVRAIAERLDTDPATMVRIVRGMQFASYRQFQHFLHELSIANATSLETMQTSANGKAPLPAQIRAALDRDLKSLDELIHGIDPSQILSLVRRMYTSDHIVLIGGDLAATLVRFLEHHLMILGLPVSCATSPAEVVHKMRFAGKKDLVIALTYGRGLRQTVEGLRQARANHAYCVAITNTEVCPITEFANECFFTNVDSPSFGPSYVAPMAFFNVVIVACANYRRGRTLAVLKKAEQEQRHGFRWYEA
jgi:RpiR family carbohydrate utilization transcriptional regulator